MFSHEVTLGSEGEGISLISGVRFEAARWTGRVWFNVRWNDRLLTRVPLQITHEGEPK